MSGKHLYNLIVGLSGPFRAQQRFLDCILAPRVHQYRCFAIRGRPTSFPFPPFSNVISLATTRSNPRKGSIQTKSKFYTSKQYKLPLEHEHPVILKGLKLGSSQLESVHVKEVARASVPKAFRHLGIIYTFQDNSHNYVAATLGTKHAPF